MAASLHQCAHGSLSSHALSTPVLSASVHWGMMTGAWCEAPECELMCAGRGVEEEGLGCYGQPAGEAGGAEGATGPGPFPRERGGMGPPPQSTTTGDAL